ncbi:OsmC family peroxiredoxin [Brevibacterium litoralis]|uniref:OsmC family peroxiredoxin n=1 Tax=Brevibacterium litoralis TaxID=3138935 RepID=UPI0032EFBF52
MTRPIVSRASTTWRGTLPEGKGAVSLDSSGAADLPVTWAARAGGSTSGVTNPEELLGAAHSACFSMALTNALASEGTPPDRLDVTADVTFSQTDGIESVHLVVVGSVPGVSGTQFEALAQKAKKECPVSKALKGTQIKLSATLR